MANEDHVVRIKQGAKVWNTWREEEPDSVPDLMDANLSGEWLSGANLSFANLSGADLSKTDLADANFYDATLSGATLSFANLSGANFSGANLSGATLSFATLGDARFDEANLSGANLNGANLNGANLRDSRFDGANLTDAMLWETQRGGWSIKGVICQRAFWDRDGKEATEYEDGAFERIFAEKPRIELHYAGGISPVDLAMLPLIIERLQVDHPASSLHIRSVQDDGSGATVTITVEDLAGRSDEAFAQDVESMRRDLTEYQERWRLSEKNLLRIEAKYEELKENFNKVIDMPKYVVGQAGAVGDNASANDMTFQQVWSQNGIDLPQLAEELKRLRAAMKAADGKAEQDEAIGAVAAAEKAAIKSDGPTTLQHLKAAGKWTLGIAEKIGVAVAAEAIKKAM